MEVEFNYCDQNEWLQYINEFIVPLGTHALNIYNFWNYLNNYVEVPISEIFKDDKLKVKLIGGVVDDGEFKSRSLAFLYKTLFGWSVYNLNEYLLHKSENIEIEVFTVRDETDFIKFILTILNYCEEIVNSAYENDLIRSPQLLNDDDDEKRLFSSDDELIEEIYKLYESITKFTINYNPKTLFIWTLRKNTKRFITFQYKKLQNSKCFETLRNIIGLYKYYLLEIPETKDKELSDKIKNEYTIWVLKDQFGSKVYSLNDFIFKSFRTNSQIPDFFNFIIENPKDFQQNNENKLERLKPLCRIPEEYNLTKRDENGHGKWDYKYLISGIFLTEFQREPSWQSKYKTEWGKCNKSLLDFLDAISPALFINKIDLIIRDNWIWYNKED